MHNVYLYTLYKTEHKQLKQETESGVILLFLLYTIIIIIIITIVAFYISLN